MHPAADHLPGFEALSRHLGQQAHPAVKATINPGTKVKQLKQLIRTHDIPISIYIDIHVDIYVNIHIGMYTHNILQRCMFVRPCMDICMQVSQ